MTLTTRNHSPVISSLAKFGFWQAQTKPPSDSSLILAPNSSVIFRIVEGQRNFLPGKAARSAPGPPTARHKFATPG